MAVYFIDSNRRGRARKTAIKRPFARLLRFIRLAGVRFALVEVRLQLSGCFEPATFPTTSLLRARAHLAEGFDLHPSVHS